MRIAVAGGTGFIGHNLVGALAESGHTVFVISRRRSIKQGAKGMVEYVAGDLHDVESLKSALNGIEVVYHLVGIIAETKTLTFEKTVIGGTKNLIAACRPNGVKKIIYLSALGTSASTDTRYFQSKWAAEEIIRNSGIPYTIFRPSVVFGPADKFINMLARMVKLSPLVPIVGNGRALLQPLYIGDLTLMLKDTLTNEKAANRIIEIGGPEQLEYPQLIAIIKKVLNKKRLNLYIPMWFMKFAATLLEAVLKPAPLTRDQLKMLKTGNICSNIEAQKIFDIKLTRLEDALKEYLR
ncbi:MAG: complex I NDUFA9 subunit family protein [candidate division Zixibacteria bacterium]|nr:complex I NDUFA9 subunit family protein [candidate division Zixibacteria bacterium]